MNPFAGRSPRGARGVAILAVITVLVALILIAIPFVISQKLGRDRTETTAARHRAMFEADLVCRAVVSFLHQTHPAYEQRRRGTGGAGFEADETVDTRSEWTPDPSYRKVIADLMPRAKGEPAPSVSDPRGSIWSWKVQDANALVNANGSSPFLVANLLGAADLAEDVDASSTTIPVTNVWPTSATGMRAFKADGGFVRIGGEVIQYGSFEDGAFRNCSRGVLRDGSPLRENGAAREHKQGERVIDYAAWKIATHLIAARPGTLTSFENLEDLKSIQRWGPGGVLEVERFEAVRPFLTTASRRETVETFLDGQLVVNALPEVTEEGGGETIRVRDPSFQGGNAAYFAPGVIVRITDGLQTDYGVVLQAGIVSQQSGQSAGQIGGAFTLANPIADGHRYEGGRANVQPLAAYPIDINSAPREVLAAVFCGLRMSGVQDQKLVVGSDLAWDLAGRIVAAREQPFAAGGDDDRRKQGPFRHVRDVAQWIEDLQTAGTLADRQAEAILRNAVNPHDNVLVYGTAPFCYRTLDVYLIEGRAVVNDEAGEKVAEAALRQVVEIGADEATAWTLDSQSDFEEGLSLGSGGKYVETYPFNVAFVNDANAFVQPRKRAPQMFMRKIYPDTKRGEDLGDVRLQPARLPLYTPTFRDSMDSSYYQDGHSTAASGAFTAPVKKNLRKDDPQDPYIHPFTVSFWMRPYSEGEWFAFDTGKMPDQNRISIFVRDTSGTGRELVFRVCDATMEERGAEVYVPISRLSYQPETWYHFHANVRGCDPSMMELLVDGVSVGRRRGLTYLKAPLNKDMDAIAADGTEGFDLKGAVVVGDEVIEYDQRTSDGFNQCFRGARGTTKRDWPEGTAVKMVGYSHPLTLDLMSGGAGLENQAWERWNFMQGQNEDDTATWSDGTSSVQFMGVAEGTASATLTLANADPADTTTDPTTTCNTFQSKGYALLWCRELDMTNVTAGGSSSGSGGGRTAPGTGPRIGGGALLVGAPAQDAPPTPGGGGGLPGRTPGSGGASSATLTGASKIGGWEIVYYEHSAGSTSINITRYQSTVLHQDTGQQFFLATKMMTPNGEEVWPCFLVPISVAGTAAGDGAFSYLDPGGNEEHKRKLGLFADDADPDDAGPDRGDRPRILVGTSDPQGSNEVICYDSIDKQKASPLMLFVRDEQASLESLASVFTGQIPKLQIVSSSGSTGTTPGSGAGSGSSGGSGGSAPRTPPSTGPRIGGGGALLASAVVPANPLRGALLRPEDAPPSPGGGVQPGVREPPPDNSGGGTVPQPLPDDGQSGIPEALRPPADAPPPDTTTPGSGSGGTTGSTTSVPTPDDLKAQFPFRGVNDTTDHRHPALSPDDAEARLLPCFRILRRSVGSHVQIGGPHAGFNDLVTFSTGETAPRRVQMRVRWSHGVQDGGRTTSWVALTDFIEGEPYVPDLGENIDRIDYRGRTRMMKFPSGEMPDEEGQNLAWCKNELGGGAVTTAFLDEVFLWRHAPMTLAFEVANQDNLTPESKEITLRVLPPGGTIAGSDGYDPDCGVIAIEGELIVYRSLRQDSQDTLTLENCRRGAFGTKARGHGRGELSRFLPDLPVSYLTSNVPRDGWSIPMKHTRRWPKEGAARLVGDRGVEVIHYTGTSDEGLVMPQAMDADPAIRGRGLLRGRYGTDAADHDNEEIVLWQPIRYWDRTMIRRGTDQATFSGIHEHPAASYVAFARTVRDAVWRRVTWTENLEGRLGGTVGSGPRDQSDRRAPSKMDLLVLVRLDQGVPWDTTKVVDLRGGRTIPPDAKEHPERFLYLLDDPETANRLDVEATTAEFRLLFPYLPGAYVQQDIVENPDDSAFENSWKNTPWLKSFTVEYQNRTKVRYSAAIR